MAHINSPHTPPPSQNRTIGPRIGGREDNEETKESAEEDEMPLGDQPPKDEEQENVAKIIENKGNTNEADLLNEGGGDLESGRPTTGEFLGENIWLN
jgi:hypothetical protein